jgi:hypothetical protein
VSLTDTESPGQAIVLSKSGNALTRLSAAMTCTCCSARASSNGLGTRKLRSEFRRHWVWRSFRVERTRRTSRKDRSRSARSFSICYATILPRTCRIVFLLPALQINRKSYPPDARSEVRRAALYNLPRTPATLPFILARTRDVDPILRRTVYHGSLSSAALPDSRILSIAQREEVVRNGLGDREGSVRKAAAGMLGDWLDQSGGELVDVRACPRPCLT